MPRFTLIRLDERPVSTRYPQLIAQVANVAFDATQRPRPNGERTADLIAAVHAQGRLALADSATPDFALIRATAHFVRQLRA